MRWKAIGQKAIGTSHILSGKKCEDAITYGTCTDANNNDVLICCVSDGAGSAKYAAEASELATTSAFNKLQQLVLSDANVRELHLIQVAEDIYHELFQKAAELNASIGEFSCTLLGAVLLKDSAHFFKLVMAP